MVLFGLIGCKSNTKMQTYIYEYYNYDKGSLNYVDTLQQWRLPNGSFQALFFKGGLKDSINYAQHDGVIRLISPNKDFVLYNSSDHNRYENEYKEDVFTPFLVPSAVFRRSKEYSIDNKKYIVYEFLTNLNTSESGYAYLSKDFGFLVYTDSPQEYKKLKAVLNLESENACVAAIKLTDEIIKDSTFFFNPHLRLAPIRFSPPTR
jgi:hypothetical protein